MTVLWWHWLVLGLALVTAELTAAGGFYIIFFGVGALVVGVLAAFGVAGSLAAQVLLFSLISILSLLLFRNRLLQRFQFEPPRPPIDTIVGEIATAAEDLVPGGVGRVELRGTAWSARNVSDHVVRRGVRCRVVRVDGLTVHIEPEGASA